MRLFVAQQGAVACKWPDGKGLKDHAPDCRRQPRRRFSEYRLASRIPLREGIPAVTPWAKKELLRFAFYSL
jgi:hypothetical protein